MHCLGFPHVLLHILHSRLARYCALILLPKLEPYVRSVNALPQYNEEDNPCGGNIDIR
jgi:hypothetical protein